MKKLPLTVSLVAMADFDEDEVVFSIPRTSVLNLTNLLPRLSPSLSQTLSAMPNWLVRLSPSRSCSPLTANQSLTSIIIAESLNPDSKWTPYLSILPRRLNSLIFWSSSQLAELQASKVVDKIGKAKAEELFSQHIAPLGLHNYDLETCHRAASIIMAYAFDIPEEKTTDTDNGNGNENVKPEEEGDDLVSDHGEDEQTMLSMIPLADMLNADADKNNARLCCDNDDLEMRTIKPIAKGEEIFNDYGSLPRSDLLRRYGYVTDQYALYDVAEISTEFILSAFTPQGRLQLPNSEQTLQLSQAELQARVELAEREGIYEESYDMNHPDDEGPSIPDELLALIFLLLIDEETLGALSTSEIALPSRSKLATELVGQVLTVLLRSREREYATTAEDDEAILLKGNLPIWNIMAVQVRMGEKKVLSAAIQEASSYSGSNKRMRDSTRVPEQPQNGSKKRKATEPIYSTRKGRLG
jgi:SET domain-containing protein 6